MKELEESTNNQRGAIEVRKRTLGAFITGNSEFETYNCILKQLKQRGILDIQIFAYRHFLRTSTLLQGIFSKSWAANEYLAETHLQVIPEALV